MCKVCEQHKIDDLADLRDIDRLAAKDPERQPGHQYATEAEAREQLEETTEKA